MRTDERAPLPLLERPPLEPPATFIASLSALGVSLDASMLGKLGSYLARLLAMNEQMNLTGIVDPHEVWEKHALDALTILPELRSLPRGARVVDVGSGGGVPGIPLAIARPDLRVTLIEATKKKCEFLAAISDALELDGLEVRAARAEDLVRGELRGAFDAVTARAVAPLVRLLPLTAPFAKPGGLVVLIKGQRADEELLQAEKVLRKERVRHEHTRQMTTGRVVVLRRS